MEKISKEFKILPPRMDFVFKRIFGDERNKDVLRLFLKAFLNLPDDDLAELYLLNTELKKEHLQDKMGIVDVKITTAKGTQIDVEIQLFNKKDMIARSLYYWSKMYFEQAMENDMYNMLCKTIAINIVDFNIFPTEKYYSTHMLHDIESKELLTDLMQIDFLELEKVRRLNPLEYDERLQWAMFIASESEEVFTMLAEKNKGIDKAYHILKTVSSDPATRELYLAQEKAIRDFNASMMYREEIGEQKGIVKGKVEGKVEANLENAKNMLKEGLGIDLISRVTGLDIQEISRLQN